jgi:DNA-binding NarL/FixJ family response regulator
MIRVLVADDHPIVRRGLKEIIAEETDMAVLGEACSSAEVLDLVRKEDWDVVILDITMPGRGGLDALDELRRLRPRLPILILSMHPEDQYGVQVLKAGAAGYLTKETAPERLAEAIRMVFTGRKYVTPALGEKLALYVQNTVDKPLHQTLSSREYQVALNIASGKKVSQIAQEMSLSVKTVSTYRARILEKMKMKTNTDLTYYFMKEGFIER